MIKISFTVLKEKIRNENNVPLDKYITKRLKVNILYLSLFSLYNIAKFFFMLLSLFILISESVIALTQRGNAVKSKLKQVIYQSSIIVCPLARHIKEKKKLTHCKNKIFIKKI